MVSMTSFSNSSLKLRPEPKLQPKRVKLKPRYWALQDAKARFSEVVRKARNEGPQHVTIHGRDEVVVLAAAEFRRLSGNVTGAALVAAMQASPFKHVKIVPTRARMPVRAVDL